MLIQLIARMRFDYTKQSRNQIASMFSSLRQNFVIFYWSTLIFRKNMELQNEPTLLFPPGR